MSRFVTGVSDYLQEECHSAMLHENMNISRLMVLIHDKYVYRYISMLEQDYKLSDGLITESLIPPQQFFQIKKDNKIVHFIAFAELFDDNDTALITSKHVEI